ncbi:MAG TPA: zinc-binding dehydrogenase, partial [Actinomycetales bacterium]|nr:zinc-binding dehydrogenase [Actinomycetales bacterium]
MRAIQITEFGGPDKLAVTDLPEPTAGDELAVIDVDTAGVNFADIHQISDTYLAPQRLPLVPGLEVVGRRRSDGARVVALTSSGGYAETVVAHPATVFEVPDDVDDAQALALIVQGTTAWHLLRTSTHMQHGEAVVVHAAAGGVGSLAVQLASHWGAGRVIATASSAEKRELAVDLGADVAVDVSACENADDVTQLLVDANDGAPVDIVLEMTGGKVFDG